MSITDSTTDSTTDGTTDSSAGNTSNSSAGNIADSITDSSTTTPPVPQKAAVDKEPVISTRLVDWNLMVNNALNTPEIVSLLTPRGYGTDVMEEGLGLISAAQTQQSALTSALGSQLQATKTFTETLKTAEVSYSDFRVTARSVYLNAAANPQPWSALNLSGRVPTTASGFISKANASYGNALNDSSLLATLARNGYDEAGVRTAQADISALDRANRAQEAAIGAGLSATMARDSAYAPTKQWVSSFKKVARRALRGRADLLKTIGL